MDPERIPLSAGDDLYFAVPDTCDWGHCNEPAICLRRAWDVPDVSHLPVCARHTTGDPVISPEPTGPGGVCSLGHALTSA